MREDREYYERKSLEDSMRNCCYCLLGLIILVAVAGIYTLMK